MVIRAWLDECDPVISDRTLEQFTKGVKAPNVRENLLTEINCSGGEIEDILNAEKSRQGDDTKDRTMY